MIYRSSEIYPQKQGALVNKSDRATVIEMLKYEVGSHAL